MVICNSKTTTIYPCSAVRSKHLVAANDDFVPKKFPEYEIHSLEEVVTRLRTQLSSVVHLCKIWKLRHSKLTGEIEMRYSAREGMLYFQDLQRYWNLYRQASRELNRSRSLLKGES